MVVRVAWEAVVITGDIDIHQGGGFLFWCLKPLRKWLIEAFNPEVEKEFSSAKFLVDLQVLYAKKALHTPKFFDSKNLHNRFSTPGRMPLWCATLRRGPKKPPTQEMNQHSTTIIISKYKSLYR